MVENLLLTVGALLTEVAMETCSSLSNGLERREGKRGDEFTSTSEECLMCLVLVLVWTRTRTRGSGPYFQVTSRLSLMVPRSLMSTATVWGRAANRSLVSQETLPTTT